MFFRQTPWHRREHAHWTASVQALDVGPRREAESCRRLKDAETR